MSGTNRIKLEDINWLEIAKRMKDDLKNPPNKVEGSFAADNIQAVAKEIEKLYGYIDWLIDMHFAETATDEFLDAKGKEVGVFRKKETRATGVARFYGKSNTFIPGGFVVSTNGNDYYTTKMAYIGKDGYVDIEIASNKKGEGTNAPENSEFTFNRLNGLERVTNTKAISGGANLESDESLRERILLKMRYPGTSGNKYHYMHWAMEVDGVGRVRVFPLWKGPGTVKVSILDSMQRPATKELIQAVQEHIDHGGERQGEALAPIGALLTVSTASVKKLNIAAKIDLDASTSKNKSMVVDEFKTLLQAYIDAEISYKKNRLTVAKVIDILYSIESVADITELTVNGSADTLEVTDEEIFAVGEVVIS